MKDKIFNDYVKQETNSSKRYYKVMGMGNVNLKERIRNENLDMLTLLSELGLIEENINNLDIINEFHEYLFKLGIEIGVADGKRMITDALKNDEIIIDEIKNIDGDKYTNFKFTAPFIGDEFFE